MNSNMLSRSSTLLEHPKNERSVFLILRNKYFYALLIFLICLIASIVLIVRVPGTMCYGVDGCDTVQASSYAKTFGIKNGYYGMVAFAIMLFLTYLQIHEPEKKRAKFIFWLSIFGSLVALRFFYLMKFVIGAYCTFCLVVDIGVILATLLLFLWKE